MGWNQLHDADMTVGYTGGWCLKYVQDAFHTDHPFATALDAWNANVGNGNHANEEPPMGITVAVYFSLGNVPAGHVAIRLSDGWVASSTQPGTHPAPYYHRNLADLISVYGQYNGGCTYLGWSEYVGDTQVVQFVPDVVTATADEVRQDYLDILERPADDGGLQTYTTNGMTNDQVRADLLASAEYKELQAGKQAAANPVVAPVHNPTPDPVVPPVVQDPAPVSEPPVSDTPTPDPLPDPTPPVDPLPDPTPLPDPAPVEPEPTFWGEFKWVIIVAGTVFAVLVAAIHAILG